MYAWRDNNIRLVLTQGEGLTASDGTVAHVKAPKFQLRDERGVIDLTSCEVSLALTRPDGSEDLLACSSASGEAAQGIISCPITASATSVAGDAVGEIRVSSTNGVIKFFGIHAKIYKGVSDLAAAQSTAFSALVNALQKVGILTTADGNPIVTDGQTLGLTLDESIQQNGTNPVASGIIYDALSIINAKDSAQDAEIAGKMNYRSVQASELDNCTETNTLYKIQLETDYITHAPVSLICINSTNKLVQYAFTRTGMILYREKYTTEDDWFEWKRIPTYDMMEEMVFDTMVRGYQDVTPDITFNIHNETTETYMATNAYSSNDYTTTYLPQSLEGNRADIPNSTTITLPSGSSKIIIYDTVTCNKRVESVSGESFTLNNIIPNRVYAYLVRNSAKKLLTYGTIKAVGQVRMIAGGGNAYNIRDLGGWTGNGGKLKYGLIYRGAELNDNVSINSSQQAFFKNVLGIRDEIDLRSSSSSAVGNTALGYGVDYLHIPLNYSPDALKDSNANRRAEIFKRIAKNVKNGKPTYIHCQAGADRTAIVCTFIEAICGVSQNEIDRDYELTSFAYDPENNRVIRQRNSDWANGHKKMVEAINEMEGNSFQDKIVRLLLRSGVTIDEINDIRFGLIDGTPSMLTNPYGTATVTKSLSHVSIDNDTSSVELYQPFEANLTVEDWYKLSSFTITMGGIDASSYYSNGRISIPRVTGNIVISATTTQTRIIPGTMLADGAVTEDKLDDGSVTRAKIDTKAVSTNKLDDEAVTHAKLAVNAVETANIKNSQVTPEKLSFTAVRYVGSNDIDECVESSVLYRVYYGGVYELLICGVGTYSRTQYLIKRDGGIQYRTAQKSNDEWGTWGSWYRFTTEDNVATMITSNTPKKMSVTVRTTDWSNNSYDITSLMPAGANENTKVDATISGAVQEQLIADGCGGIYVSTDTSNSTTTFTMHALYNTPTANITVQLILTQLVSI